MAFFCLEIRLGLRISTSKPIILQRVVKQPHTTILRYGSADLINRNTIFSITEHYIRASSEESK